ncbi:hypothetical protein GCM10010124_13690 [Pilimelia terevasa]|uniref:Uncharacterized protein n=1 Tax=Pilimelia terevasa TaxID=53372 RepID=A0A8J3BIT6_9ACTN|nr:hypothetical protein GCM10010124_13690 [Pilimelia terevasa]
MFVTSFACVHVARGAVILHFADRAEAAGSPAAATRRSGPAPREGLKLRTASQTLMRHRELSDHL